MQRWITGYHRAAERPDPVLSHQLCANRIGQHIETNPRECAAFALFLTQNMVVGLMLELVWLKHGRRLAAEKSHGIELVTFTPHPHPDDVQVIEHQTIRRTPNLLTNCRVQHKFPKTGMKRFVQPAGVTMLHSQRPQDNRMTLVMMAKQPRQIVLLFNKLAHLIVAAFIVAAFVKTRISSIR